MLPWLQPEVEVNYEKASGAGVDEQVLALTGGLVMPFGDGYRVVAAVQHGVWGRNTAQVTAGVLSFKAAFE